MSCFQVPASLSAGLQSVSWCWIHSHDRAVELFYISSAEFVFILDGVMIEDTFRTPEIRSGSSSLNDFRQFTANKTKLSPADR